VSEDIQRRFEANVDPRFFDDYLPAMSTIAEIEAVLPKLTAEELARVEQAVHKQYRERGGGIIYDDAYGVVTDADLIASADEAFQAYDQAETKHAKRPAR
jgi:hypothetical protein